MNTEQYSRAACLGKDPDLWFPERDQGPRGGDEAKAICEGCPVIRECLAVGLSEDFGIWGATSPAERKRMR